MAMVTAAKVLVMAKPGHVRGNASKVMVMAEPGHVRGNAS